MATDFGQNLRNDLYLTRWRFETDTINDYRNFDSKRFNGNIFSTYFANMMIGPVTLDKLQIVPRFTDRRSFTTWRSEMDWNITILISAG